MQDDVMIVAQGRTSMPHPDTASTDTGTCVDDGAASIFSASEYGAQWIIFEGGKMGTRLFLSAFAAVVFGLTGANPSSAQCFPDKGCALPKCG
jgi:hypothetical protein